MAAESLADVVLTAEEAAAKRLADSVSDEAVDRMIPDAQALYARGMTTRAIQAHLAEVYGADVSAGLVSNGFHDRVRLWRS